MANYHILPTTGGFLVVFSLSFLDGSTFTRNVFVAATEAGAQAYIQRVTGGR